MPIPEKGESRRSSESDKIQTSFAEIVARVRDGKVIHSASLSSRIFNKFSTIKRNFSFSDLDFVRANGDQLLFVWKRRGFEKQYVVGADSQGRFLRGTQMDEEDVQELLTCIFAGKISSDCSAKVKEALAYMETKFELKAMPERPRLEFVGLVLPVACPDSISNDVLKRHASSGEVHTKDLINSDISSNLRIIRQIGRDAGTYEFSDCPVPSTIHVLFSSGLFTDASQALDLPYADLIPASTRRILELIVKKDYHADHAMAVIQKQTAKRKSNLGCKLFMTPGHVNTHSSARGLQMVQSSTGSWNNAPLLLVDSLKSTPEDSFYLELDFPKVSVLSKNYVSEASVFRLNESLSFDFSSRTAYIAWQSPTLKSFKQLSQMAAMRPLAIDTLTLKPDLPATELAEVLTVFGDLVDPEQRACTVEARNLASLKDSDIGIRFVLASKPKDELASLTISVFERASGKTLKLARHWPALISLLNSGLGVYLENFLSRDAFLWVYRISRVLKHHGLGAWLVSRILHLIVTSECRPNAADTILNELDDYYQKLDIKMGEPDLEAEIGLDNFKLLKTSLEEVFAKVTPGKRELALASGGIVALPESFAKRFASSLLTVLQFVLQQNRDYFVKSRWNGFANFSSKYWIGKADGSYQLPLKQASSMISLLPGNVDEIVLDGKVLQIASAEDVKSEVCLGESDQGIDWFDLHPKTFFKGVELSKESARSLAKSTLFEHEGKLYLVDRKQIPQLKWLNYFWERINSSKSQRNRWDKLGIFATAPNETLNMLALTKAGIPVVGGAKWQAIQAAFLRMERRAASGEEISEELKSLPSLLKPYQRLGVQWLVDHYDIRIGGILADDMGLGKTLQMLCLFDILKSRGSLQTSLIVVPTTLVHNWIQEIKRFTPQISVAVFDPKMDFGAGLSDQPKPDLVITSYGMLVEHSEKLAVMKWDIAVFDEAQNLKNIHATRTGEARKLTSNVKFALSGTPLENHMGELFSLVDLVACGALGPYPEFASSMQIGCRQISVTDEYKEAFEFTKLKIRPLILRRTKELLAGELPEKTESVKLLEFDSVQKKIYKATAISWNHRVKEVIQQKGQAAGQLHMLTALLRLRQICSTPSSVPTVEFNRTPPKFELLIEALSELRERAEPAIVFASFVSTLEPLKVLLEKKGFKVLMLHGQVPAAKRGAILDSFSNGDEHAVLLMTQKVGGVGLNLTRCSHVFHLEPWWNPAVENQATDRVHRLGQTKNVQVFRYIMQHSVEEKIQLLKNRKSALFSDLFDSERIECDSADSFARQSISKADFDYLVDLN